MEPFYLISGGVVNNIQELAAALKHMDESTYRHHVNDQKNDFANWLENSLGFKILAKKVKSSKNKKEMIRNIKKFQNSDSEAEKIKKFLEEKNSKTRKMVKKEGKLEKIIDPSEVNMRLNRVEMKEIELSKRDKEINENIKDLEKKIESNQKILKKINDQKADITKRNKELVNAEKSLMEKLRVIDDKTTKLNNLKKKHAPKVREMKEKEKRLESYNRLLKKKEKHLNKIEDHFQKRKMDYDKLHKKAMAKIDKDLTKRINELEEIKIKKAQAEKMFNKLMKRGMKNKEERPVDPLNGQKMISFKETANMKKAEQLIKSINKSLKKGKKAIARKSYHELISLYDRLEEQEKHILYDDVYKLYDRLS